MSLFAKVGNRDAQPFGDINGMTSNFRRPFIGSDYILELNLQGTQIIETAGANASKLIQKLRKIFAAALFDMPASIEWVEGFAFSVLKNYAGARHPVNAIGVDEMADDIYDRESFAAFIVVRPRFRQPSQQLIQCARGALQQSHGVLQIVCHESSMQN